jgi:hypothetical protein
MDGGRSVLAIPGLDSGNTPKQVRGNPRIKSGDGERPEHAGTKSHLVRFRPNAKTNQPDNNGDSGGPAGSALPLDDQLLDRPDRLGGVEAFRAGIGAVHDRVAAIKLERIFQVIQALAGRLIA